MKKNILFFLVIFVLFFFLNSKFFDKGPISKHSWAQADHYAVALGFLNNNFDFFHPETYCLNPQFGPGIKGNNASSWSNYPNSPEGITAIDFPIHHYIIAGIMKITRYQHPMIFRLYMFILSFIGLFFLFKTSMEINNSYTFSYFIVLFVLLSPTFNYYSANFLPSSASLSFLFIGSYLYVKYIKTKEVSFLIRTIIILTISALARLPFVIYMIALSLSFLLLFFVKKKTVIKEFIYIILGLSIVFIYFLYNKYLSFNYGSNFLNHPLPPSNLKVLFDSIYQSIIHQAGRYFTFIHYIFLALLIYHLVSKKVFNNFKKFNFSFIFLIWVSIGVLSYSFLMIRQFPVHDYYFLDTFFPIIVFWLIFLSNKLLEDFKLNMNYFLASFVILALLGNRIIFNYGYTTKKDNPYEITRANFEGSSLIMDSLNISKNAKILLIDSYSPNLAFIGMGRKGYCVMTPSYENIKRGLNWKYDYIITQNFTFETDVLSAYPNFNSETISLYSNNKFTIHLKK